VDAHADVELAAFETVEEPGEQVQVRRLIVSPWKAGGKQR
jgi:hypothetical protein